MNILNISLSVTAAHPITRAGQRRYRKSMQIVNGTGVVWPVLACVILLAGTSVAWLYLPLMRSYSGWALPVDLGWGMHSVYITYGLLLVTVGGVIGVRTLLAFSWRGTWRDHDAISLRLRPLTPRTLLWLGLLCTSVTLLFIYQFVLVDFGLVARLADQENQSLLIRAHLGYQLAPQHLLMQPFHVNIATPLDRILLLVQLVYPGLLLPIVAGLACCYGAYQLRRNRVIAWREGLYPHPPARYDRRWVWAVIVLLGIIILGRAPLALLYQQWGVQATQQGMYGDALDDFAHAQKLNPALTALLSFHQERGQVLAQIHNTLAGDAGLYRAAQWRAGGALAQAWRVDQQLDQQHPTDAAIKQDMAITLAMLVEAHASAGIPARDQAQLQLVPLTPLQDPNAIVPAIDQTLPWLAQLLALHADTTYAHYMRGRILFLNQSYDLAASDFRAVLTQTTDHELASASYTYQALSAGATGDYAQERALLMKAVKLDGSYDNTIAREAASGLH